MTKQPAYNFKELLFSECARDCALIECLECAEKKYQEDIEIIEEYTRRTYSSSTASKLMEWIRDNLTPEQLETLKKKVEEINKTRMEMKNLTDTMKKERGERL